MTEFKFKGIINEDVQKLVKESVLFLKWNSPNIKRIIIRKKCQNCGNDLMFVDKHYDTEKILIFIRICLRCKRLYILSGYFENYTKVKDYFINLFRMEMYKKNNEMRLN